MLYLKDLENLQGGQRDPFQAWYGRAFSDCRYDLGDLNGRVQEPVALGIFRGSGGHVGTLRPRGLLG